MLQLITYNNNIYKQEIILNTANLEAAIIPLDIEYVHWINIEMAQQKDWEEITSLFPIHHLILQDIKNIQHIPKTEMIDDSIFMVIKMLHWNKTYKKLVAEHVSILLFDNYIITFQEGIQDDVLADLRHRLKNNIGLARKNNASYLFIRIVTTIIYEYHKIVEELRSQIESLEQSVLSNPNKNISKEIIKLKKDLIILRRFMSPLKEAIAELKKEKSELLTENLTIYIQDAYDHILDVVTNVTHFQDKIKDVMDLQANLISQQMNAIMKTLTVISVIFMPLTFIAGVYGMNFEYMPELHSKMGYPVALCSMLLIAVIMVAFMKWKKWL